MRIVHLALAMCFFATVNTATADLIVKYRFLSKGKNLRATTYGHPLTASDMAFGTGLTQATGNFGNRLGLDTFLSTTESSSIADAVANHSFIEFTTRSDHGWSVDLRRMRFHLSGYDPYEEATQASVAWSLRTSIDGYSADVDTGINRLEFPNREIVTVPLKSPGLNANGLQNVSFRLYFSHWGTGASTGVVVDQISLLGQTVQVVPGPGGLMALGGLGLARGRRRR